MKRPSETERNEKGMSLASLRAKDKKKTISRVLNGDANKTGESKSCRRKKGNKETLKNAEIMKYHE